MAAKYQRECPCCGKKVQETEGHLLLLCRMWKEGRVELMGDYDK